MYTAQSQADFMAATGSMTHSGPGGIGLTDRLLAAGYPLAGDLSLGGFRSENITGGHEGKTAQEAVNGWTGDAPHLNTMISPSLTEIGAGVAVSGGRVYYVIDAARPTDSGAPPVAVPSVGGGSAVPGVAAVILPVTLSTPDADGNIIHEVQAGQTLWQIAIAYEARIDEIKGLNNLFDNNIYPGNRLLIKKSSAPTGSPTEAVTQAITSTTTRLPTSTAAAVVTLTPIPAVVNISASADNSGLMKVALGIVALALLGGGFFTWLGSRQKK
jgi:LysM repeat protein